LQLDTPSQIILRANRRRHHAVATAEARVERAVGVVASHGDVGVGAVIEMPGYDDLAVRL